MDEEWVEIRGFDNYYISNQGRVRNENRGRLVKMSLTGHGVVKVGLVREGTQYTRSVKVLVADAFVEGRSELFDTPMHLDSDQLNNTSDNLVWRPRWFAWKYTRQFTQADYYKPLGAILDTDDKTVYEDVIKAAVKNGLLFYDIARSVLENERVFPTWQMFEKVID